MPNFVKYTMEEFLKITKDEFLKSLCDHSKNIGFEVDEWQVKAWSDCYDFLKEKLGILRAHNKNLTMLFEYTLPLENNRRPDVILFTGKKVIILEFKMKDNYIYKDIEQTIGYREDIKNFHEYTVKNNLDVKAFLVLSKSKDIEVKKENGLEILSKENFINKMLSLIGVLNEAIDIDKWGSSLYNPHPNIIEATQNLFFNGELPYIKSIAEGDISKSVNSIENLILSNEKDHKKRIIFIGGVPGAGKTLVGLKTVYNYNKYTYETKNEPIKAIYLSGNGPLVNVLQTQLSKSIVNGIEGKSYIKGLTNYKKEYLEKDNVPNQTVLVFDESQRAWDEEKMKEYYDKRKSNKNIDYSEAEALLNIGNEIYDNEKYVTILCLFGEGQVIHKGEEKGMQLWVDALSNNKDWEIYIPKKYNSIFENINNNIIIDDNLYLDTSIRTNFVDISKWIESALNTDKEVSKKELDKLKKVGFKIRITRDFNRINQNMPRYGEIYEHKYGLLVSSKVEESKLRSITNNICQTSFLRPNEAGNWFLEECENLNSAASEFLCQGLEIDMPIVIFGGDYLIKNNKWTISEKVNEKYENEYENLDNIMASIYRVLLSRGRKGMILYIPNMEEFNETYEFFKNIGVPIY